MQGLETSKHKIVCAEVCKSSSLVSLVSVLDESDLVQSWACVYAFSWSLHNVKFTPLHAGQP